MGREETILNSTEKKNIFNKWNHFSLTCFILKQRQYVVARGREVTILNSTEKKNIFNI